MLKVECYLLMLEREKVSDFNICYQQEINLTIMRFIMQHKSNCLLGFSCFLLSLSLHNKYNEQNQTRNKIN